MLKRTLTLIALCCFCTLSAEEPPAKYFQLINVECNDVDAYDFDPRTVGLDRPKRIGHLVKMSFPSVQKELVADLSLSNPEKPEVKDSVVGVLKTMRWEGNPNDPLSFDARVSFQNHAIMQEALSSITGNPEIEVEFVIYDFDYDKNKYFKRFYTLKTPLKFSVEEGSKIYIREDLDYYCKKPINFSFEVSLQPKNGIKNQKVGFAFSSTGPKSTRPMGSEVQNP